MGSTWSRLRAEQPQEDDLLSSQHLMATFVFGTNALTLALNMLEEQRTQAAGHIKQPQ